MATFSPSPRLSPTSDPYSSASSPSSQSPNCPSLDGLSSPTSWPATPWTGSPTCSSLPYAAHLAAAGAPVDGPVDLILDDFDVDAALQLDAYIRGIDRSTVTPPPDSTAIVDASAAGAYVDTDRLSELNFEYLLNLSGPFTPPNTTSAASPVYGTLGFNESITPPRELLTPDSLPATGTTSPALLYCPVASCGKYFSNTSALRRHERTHRDDYRCPVAHCGKGHADQRHLNRHLWAKHREYAARHRVPSENARCQFCDYMGRGDNLKRHMARHVR
ncbi:741bc7bf-a911-4e2c-8bc0-3a702f11ab22 [Thermothielavioides terrestris]|uniref:C2H2-type domain-containing protein n=2 Tax=Thermothielavioides terrestris TaxID=2587410 RepID=G2QVF7_THETT|nr:uncharacterized protein THITE_2110929 [Thermothielavioides terrestris NRRL 8126]AEO64647.1 hypothetical protein THITE_2110929 [Thermothielavioides terrestris NRRL 8126]SPQ26502.1 741bc7bf-a911-4e2c-8bc0-3a702f11ab22 [Thermothielavioides terrestris]